MTWMLDLSSEAPSGTLKSVISYHQLFISINWRSRIMVGTYQLYPNNIFFNMCFLLFSSLRIICIQVGDIYNATCARCRGGCVRECAGGKIDSVAAAEQFRGCTHIKGKLEITLRAGGGKTSYILLI